MKPIVFSLIVATVNRTEPLLKLLNSLVIQTFKDFEVVIVDQNVDDRLKEIIRKFDHSLNIKYFKSDIGLSKARNVGLLNSISLFVAFPDDDCWYEANMLENVYNYINNFHLDGLTCVARDEKRQKVLIPFLKKESYVTKNKIWKQAISFTIFVKRYNDMAFDEGLGLGTKTKFIACEETDYLLKILENKNAKIKYIPSLYVYHPKPLINKVPEWKVYGYNLAIGLMCKRYKLSVYRQAEFIYRPLIGMVLMYFKFKPEKANFYWNSLKGRIAGLLENED